MDRLVDKLYDKYSRMSRNLEIGYPISKDEMIDMWRLILDVFFMRNDIESPVLVKYLMNYHGIDGWNCVDIFDVNINKVEYKGKSFDFSIWNPIKTYVNNEFKQDFVSYQGKLYACIKNNTNVPPTEDRYWVLCVDGWGEGDISSMSFDIGEGEPTNMAAVNESIYLDILTGEFWEFKTDKWVKLGSLSQDSLEWAEY